MTLKQVAFALALLCFSAGSAGAHERAIAAMGGPGRLAEPFAYTITNIGTLPGYTSSDALGIDNRGDVVGDVGGGNPFANPPSLADEAVVFGRGVLTGLGPVATGLPGPYASYAYAINNAGNVVGTIIDLNQSSGCDESSGAVAFAGPGLGGLGGTCPHGAAYGVNARGDAVGSESSSLAPFFSDAVLFHAGRAIVLGANAAASGINDSGIAVGQSAGCYGCTSVAAIFALHSRPTQIGTLGGPSSYGAAINNSGVAVGASDISKMGSYQHAFIYLRGKMFDLGVPAGFDPSTTSSYAVAINAHNEVVGSYLPSGGDQAAFVYANGAMRDLTSLIPPRSGWTLTAAAAINDRGEIVGTGSYRGQTLGFLLHPVRTAAGLSR
jgi:probable HAF family extracellular repeat protein